jgi:hypothetical protein
MAEQDALVERLKVIEDQPLETRAAAYGAVLAELQSALESADER